MEVLFNSLFVSRLWLANSFGTLTALVVAPAYTARPPELHAAVPVHV